jgi:hypothetical protein
MYHPTQIRLLSFEVQSNIVSFFFAKAQPNEI